MVGVKLFKVVSNVISTNHKNIRFICPWSMGSVKISGKGTKFLPPRIGSRPGFD